MTYYTESNPTPKFDTAGGIVLCNKKLLFIYKRGMWDLPKGKIEFNHTTESTALREISEETGLKENDLTVINKLPKTKYYKKVNGEAFLKKNYWFIINYTGDPLTTLVPDQSEGITECKWVDLNNLDSIITNTHARISYLIDYFLNDPDFENYLNGSVLNN
ncbi:MAG: NUDIX hydrolase [Candidatus Neomarinimicrobiota bacterium]|jgi:8-oxo-dGTP pyrophosphatase MutT (NUDIX family)|tara:strand:+ start:1485 stop:1967 length:483 start_codon:yes stop_codon:yes gene_type:complete